MKSYEIYHCNNMITNKYIVRVFIDEVTYIDYKLSRYNLIYSLGDYRYTKLFIVRPKITIRQLNLILRQDYIE